MKARGFGVTALAILAACGGAKATDDLKPKEGGYSAVPEEKMSDAPSPSASPTAAANVELDGADYLIDGESVLKDLKRAFLACDAAGTKSFVPGTETIELEVANNGEVTTATPRDRVGLNDDIENCLRRVAMGAEFAPLPPGKTGRFAVPVQFTRSPIKARHR
ncbi:MAG: hypothetical protein ABI551_17655 [Polyangiaceae bacterium]